MLCTVQWRRKSERESERMKRTRMPCIVNYIWLELPLLIAYWNQIVIWNSIKQQEEHSSSLIIRNSFVPLNGLAFALCKIGWIFALDFDPCILAFWPTILCALRFFYLLINTFELHTWLAWMNSNRGCQLKLHVQHSIQVIAMDIWW